MTKQKLGGFEPVNFEQLYPERTRFEEIKKTVEVLRTGRSCQVIGFPGVGKSNVLRLLTYNTKVRQLHLGEDNNRFHFVYMDFSEVSGRDIFDVLKYIFISLSYSLGERKLTREQAVINGFLQEALKFSDELILFQGLKKSVDYLGKEQGLYLVFLFDRFEDYLPDISDKFFLDLRILRNRIKYQFLSVFAVTRPIEDILDTTVTSEFYEFIAGNTIFLPIKDPIGLEFRFSYIEKITGKKSPPGKEKEIEQITGGHGKLAKLSFETVLSDPYIKDVKNLLLSKPQIKGALFEIWNYLTPEEKIDIKENTENAFLEKIDLVSKGEITIPLFSEFVRFLSIEKTGGSIIYNESRNEIVKGKENITDKLTPSEFRLLKYLIINEGKVCEKDEIIKNVWKDSKTQEGVTDQALDQIVYRLRKKIEEEPTTPTHLQTVKGRGYKFVDTI